MTPKKAPVVGRTTELEFGGVLGASLMVLGLPVGVFAINILCNKSSCQLWPLPDLSLNMLTSMFNKEAFMMFLVWFLFQLVLHLLPLGTTAQGLPLRTKNKLEYTCNGFAALVISFIQVGFAAYQGYPLTRGYTLFLQLAASATVFSYVLAVYLYVRALSASNHELAQGGNSGWHVYDFFIGRELNPRVGPVDLKFFCEMRPGLIGWIVLDLCFLAQAYEIQGHIPPALALVVVFHTLYVADALWHEEAILTTMDIAHEGFGLMLAFGDLVWVPFLYCLQARYLLEHPQAWSVPALISIALLNMLGYYIFRSSNSQKNKFRNNPTSPTVKHLETMSTASGRKLLVSGWWGMCRHPNYMGDLIMALSWSLTCGFDSILPYFYPIYFLVLLIHRFQRDDVMCRKKYGEDWDLYCNRVPYKIFPYIY